MLIKRTISMLIIVIFLAGCIDVSYVDERSTNHFIDVNLVTNIPNNQSLKTNTPIITPTKLMFTQPDFSITPRPTDNDYFNKLTSTSIITSTNTITPTNMPFYTPTYLGGGHGKVIFLTGNYDADQWNVYSTDLFFARAVGQTQLTFRNTTINHPVWSPKGV
jgi:hypothetical protein